MQRTWKFRGLSNEPGQRIWMGYLYILPALAIYGFFVLWPIVQMIRLSLYEWDGLTKPIFVGFKNFVTMSKDALFLKALGNNLEFVVFYTLFPIAIGFLLTAMMSRSKLRGLTIFRAGLFIPQVMAMVAVGVVWKWIYNPAFGPLTQVMRAIGLGAFVKPWLGDFNWALPAVGLVGTWVQYGFCMVLFMAGVQRIEEALYDSARIDGANEFQQFWNVTLPGLRNELSIALVTTMIAAMRIFDLVYVTTRGSPAGQTMVVSMWLYRNAFQINRVGYAAAIALVQTVIVLIISYFIISLRLKSQAEQ